MQFFAFWTIIAYVLYVIKLSMKKVFIQFWQWILKHKKRLIYGALAFFIGQICFFNLWWIGIQNQVFAASDREWTDQKAEFEKLVTEKVSLMDFFRKTVYIILYPLMFLAGKLVDNSLVYWTMFNFDTVLWNLWNVMRNLANFGLGFIFIYYIFKYLITQDKKKDPKRLIKRSLIAWILIQASWFLMAALIDLSTIMIYWIWGLPVSILSSTEDLNKKYNGYVMKNIISVDANDISNMNFYLTNILTWAGTQIYISECDTFSIKDNGGKKGSQEYILAPKMIYYQNLSWNFINTEDLYCDYYGSVYKFKSLFPDLNKRPCDKNSCSALQSEYDKDKNDVKSFFINNTDLIEYSVNAWEILEPYKKVGTPLDYGWDEDNMDIGPKNTIQTDVLMKSQDTKTYVWAFTSLYASLLEDWRWLLPATNSSIYINFLSCWLTLWHALALAIPLAAAVLVLLMRVAIIWMAIVLSPMIVLLSAFDFLDKYKDKDNILGYFQIENLLWIIFSPVFICFAVSMSKVLVWLIEKISYKDVVFKNNFQVLWIIQMDLAWFSVWLAQLIIWVMWVAMSWFLVWMAVKASKLWKSGLITSVEKLAKNGLWTIPLVPVPWKDWKWVEFIGANSAFWLNDHKSMLETINSGWLEKYNSEDNETLNQFLNPEEAKKKAAEKVETNKFNWYSTKLLGLPLSEIQGGKWVEAKIDTWEGKVSFNDLSNDKKKSIIDNINSLGKDKAGKDKADVFGQIGTITIWSTKYKYDKEKSHTFIEDKTS